MATQVSAVGRIGIPEWLVHLSLPLIFVVLYGSGFVGAKLGLPHASPFSFLALRFGLAAAVMILIAKAIKAPWPQSINEAAHIACAGLLGVGLFSAGAYASIERGVSPAVSALIIALNPILVALAAGPLLGERTNLKQFLGLAIGVAGVYLVLHDRIAIDPSYLTAASLSVLALIGLAAGNLYQKKKCSSMNLFTGGAIQTMACTLVMGVGVLLSDEKPIQWAPEFIASLIWTSLAISIGAVSILYLMIRRAEVSRVASVFFLMPVSAAVLTFLLFGQNIGATAMVGIGITALGVFLAQKR